MRRIFSFNQAFDVFLSCFVWRVATYFLWGSNIMVASDEDKIETGMCHNLQC